MATLTPADTHAHDDHHGDYITCSKGIMSWIITLDHKRIGVMYVIATLASFLLGGVMAVTIMLTRKHARQTLAGLSARLLWLPFGWRATATGNDKMETTARLPYAVAMAAGVLLVMTGAL